METQRFFYRSYLKEELGRRCQRNPRYSLRAFAKALGITPGTLSKILNARQPPSYKLSQKFLERLELSPQERSCFLSSVAQHHRSQNRQRMNPELRSLPLADDLSRKTLDTDVVRALSEWYHSAILELSYVEGFKSDPKWIASELGISQSEAQLAIERLIELNLLTRDSRGHLRKTHAHLASADKSVTAPALRMRQRQSLERAVEALENHNIARRSTTSTTMAIDPDLLPEAKKMISEFTTRLCAFLESGRRKEVYEMSVALFSVHK